MKKALIGAIIFVMAVSTGCLDKNKQATQSQTENKQNQEQAKEQSRVKGSFSLRDLMGMDKGMRCTWTDPENKDEVQDLKMELFISGKKFRQNVGIQGAGEGKLEMSPVSDGAYVYTWGGLNEKGKGSKISLAKMEEAGRQMGSGQNKAGGEALADTAKKLDYDCEPWNADSNLFNPPGNIEFTDETDSMVEAVKQIQKVDTKDIKEQTCHICDMAPNSELKAKCRKDVKCD